MENLGSAFQIMGQGMLGIFTAIVLIMLSVLLLQKIFKNK